MFLAASVGFVELHPATCDSISDVRLRIVVVILELVNAELRVAGVARSIIPGGLVVFGVFVELRINRLTVRYSGFALCVWKP